MMAVMVTMSAAFRVGARLQVAHIDFLCLLFAHFTFLTDVWVVSVALFQRLHATNIITRHATKFGRSVLTRDFGLIRTASRSFKAR